MGYIACQVSLSMGLPRQEYWSGLPFPPGDLPDLGIKPMPPAEQADSLPEPPGKPRSLSKFPHIFDCFYLC